MTVVLVLVFAMLVMRSVALSHECSAGYDVGIVLLSHPSRWLGRLEGREHREEPLAETDADSEGVVVADLEVAIAQRGEVLMEVESSEIIPDGTSMEHVNVPATEAVASGVTTGYKFGVDGKTLNKFEQCYIEGQRTSLFRTPDNIENTMRNAHGQLNSDGTDRGDWAKCLPPPMYTLLTMESFNEGDIESGEYEKKMKLATDFYTTLKWLHNEACAHIRLNIADSALQQRIKDELNNHATVDVGQKIADAVGVIASEIVRQYRSFDPALNQDNAAALAGLEALAEQARIAVDGGLNADFVTIQDIGGQRSARHRLADLHNAAKNIKEQVDAIKTFLGSRPSYQERLSDDFGSRRRRQTMTDGLLDAVQNVGMCGVKGRQPADNSELFEAHGFLTYTLGLGLSQEGSILVETLDGMQKPEDVVKAANVTKIFKLLPGGTVTPDNHLPSYQDDLFAQGNLACGARSDSLWTIVTSDRDNESNPVTTTQEEGYFCIWELDDVTVLPKNQRNGFSNTEFVAESPEKMAEVLNGRPEFYEGFFPGEGKQKFYHCHYTPRNSGSMRVHSFQHQAERHYPGAVRQICGCDWRKLGMLVSRCDCTLDGEANGGCRKAEKEMLNEHTQKDFWAESQGRAAAPSQVALSHAKLAHGKIVSYDYDDGDIEVRAFQDDTGRVRKAGSNDDVCAVNNYGEPESNARSYDRHLVVNARSYDRRRHSERSFFTDMNMDGIIALPDCRQSSIDRGDCTFANYSKGEAEEFGLRDFQSKRWFSRKGLPYVAVPSGGVNTEFINAAGKPCDPLDLGRSCKAATADGLVGKDLVDFLVSFCDTPASLYKVPQDETGKVPIGFGKVEMPLPLLDGSNYRAYARANFGRLGNGTWLHCMGGICNDTHPAPAAQGVLDPNETVASSCDADPNACGCDSARQADYRGKLAVTQTGLACQRWDSQLPHSHARTPGKLPSAGLEDNYCRNPDGERKAWCYTTDPNTRWEFCSVPSCSSSTGLFKGFSIMVGGAIRKDQPSVVPVEWYDLQDSASGIFTSFVTATHINNTANMTWNHPAEIQAKIDAKIKAAVGMVKAEDGRRFGVTCSNGKYVYVRKAEDGSRPVVSTIREGYNRDGPRPSRGSFGCRYVGVFCNNNNCNNNGDQDVPGPFDVYSYKNNRPYIA